MKRILLSGLLICLFTVMPVFADNSADSARPANSVDLNEMFTSNSSEKNDVQTANIDNSSNSSVMSNFSKSDDDSDNTELKGYVEYDGENSLNDENLNNSDDEKPLYIQQAQEVESSENSVGLSDNDFKRRDFNLKAPPKFATKSLMSPAEKDSTLPNDNSILLQASSKFSNPEYLITSVYTSCSTSTSIPTRKFSVGTSFYSGLDSASLSSSTGVFTRYDGKHFAISSSFSNDSQYNDNSYSHSFSFAPELKLTKRLSFIDVLSTDLNQVDKSNRMVLRYNPKLKNHPDDVQLEVGIGQSFYENQYVKSSVSFSTRFKL
jgi:hypothetical protein